MTDDITQQHRDDINGRLNAMKNADAGTKDKEKHDAAVHVDATWREKSELVAEARRLAPDLSLPRVCEVVRDWFDGETSNRESNKVAAGQVADGDPRDAVVIPAAASWKANVHKEGKTLPEPPEPPAVPPGQAKKEAR